MGCSSPSLVQPLLRCLPRHREAPSRRVSMVLLPRGRRARNRQATLRPDRALIASHAGSELSSNGPRPPLREGNVHVLTEIPPLGTGTTHLAT
jgi:hypothetical protein